MYTFREIDVLSSGINNQLKFVEYNVFQINASKRRIETCTHSLFEWLSVSPNLQRKTKESLNGAHVFDELSLALIHEVKPNHSHRKTISSHNLRFYDDFQFCFATMYGSQAIERCCMIQPISQNNRPTISFSVFSSRRRHLHLRTIPATAITAAVSHSYH